MPRNAALPLLLALAWALLLLLASVTTVACHPTTESTWEPSAEVAASEPDMARNPRAASYGTCLRQPGDAREWASGRSQARYSFNSAWSRMGSGCDTITTVRNAIAVRHVLKQACCPPLSSCSSPPSSHTHRGRVRIRPRKLTVPPPSLKVDARKRMISTYAAQIPHCALSVQIVSQACACLYTA